MCTNNGSLTKNLHVLVVVYAKCVVEEDSRGGADPMTAWESKLNPGALGAPIGVNFAFMTESLTTLKTVSPGSAKWDQVYFPHRKTNKIESLECARRKVCLAQLSLNPSKRRVGLAQLAVLKHDRN